MYRIPEPVMINTKAATRRANFAKAAVILLLLCFNTLIYRLFFSPEEWIGISSMLAMMLLYVGILAGLGAFLTPLPRSK